MTTQNLLIELLTEELPPKALPKLGEAFAAQLLEQLRAQGLADAQSQATAYATPRRLAAHIGHVKARADDKPQRIKLMPVAVALNAEGQPTPALLKKLQSLGLDAAAAAQLERAPDGKAEALFAHTVAKGVALADGLQKALDEAIARLPIPKVMTYQLQSGTPLPGWDSVQFVRPAHALVALHGADVVPVTALGLPAGRRTQGHRFEAQAAHIDIAHADGYARDLLEKGAVIAGFAERRQAIEDQIKTAISRMGQGFSAIKDEALLDEVTALVERPNVLLCQFEPDFLQVPQECLILTMKANQKYFPILNADGRLTHHFLVVSNITPDDAGAVIGGNERVVRPRLADAKFFFDTDRKKTLQERVPGLDKVVYHNKLGSQGERMQRVRHIARAIAAQLQACGANANANADAAAADTAAQLAKADLLTDMVGEFPELQGTMGRYYALHDGLSADVADAIEDHYKPRFAGDGLPRGATGTVLALADKLETLAGMFGIGNLPTGERDPFALRRHALGVLRILREKRLPLSVADLLQAAFSAFSAFGQAQGFDAAKALPLLNDFITDRLAGSLREEGRSAAEADAVLRLSPALARLDSLGARLDAVRAFQALPEAPALAAANKRIGNILKKAEGDTPAQVSESLLQEPAERELFAAMQTACAQANAQFDAGDYTASLQTLAQLRAPVDAFFEHVMVNAEQPEVRANRLGLLKTLHQAMNRVADLARLSA